MLSVEEVVRWWLILLQLGFRSDAKTTEEVWRWQTTNVLGGLTIARIADNEPTVAIESLDAGFLWNSYMIQPLVDFRSSLGPREKTALDESGILTSAIRGFCQTMIVPISSASLHRGSSGPPSSMAIISRLSCLRAGTRFNARGIDDDGNVANFVETETIFWSPTGVCFSYVQVRGSVPIFWEQQGSLVAAQKITITRSEEATQPAFDRHFENLEHSYGAIHVINLLSKDKAAELDLILRYRYHTEHNPLNSSAKNFDNQLLRSLEYDFHAETRNGASYEEAARIKHKIQPSADAFGYFLSEDVEEKKRDGMVIRRTIPIIQQEGIFRTNCLDCLDRTNFIQDILSRMALEAFFHQQDVRPAADFWARHRTLWADNGDNLSRTYAGTGALKSSFTRHGKKSLGGLLSDVRKSVTRTYINNFTDKDRQNTIDMLLGRLQGQKAVQLQDPVSEYVQAEIKKRSHHFVSTKEIHILVGTFNLNGKERGMQEDLSSWLCPDVAGPQRNPEIVAIGFQEIVELNPQQILGTDPSRRQAWEATVKNTLNENAEKNQEEEYVLLRGEQLVGASLSIFVRTSLLPYIKNVEGTVRKTGMSGMAGNKGAAAIRMDYANSSLCFVTAHLAAGFENYQDRNRDYRTINEGLRFQRNKIIDDHDSVIWLGDFNYRIGLGNAVVRRHIKEGDLESLYNNDQLNIQMRHGLVFPFYSEAPITFLPTYKFDNGTDEYDTSEKSRVPAWTDRVLSKGDTLRQIVYNSAPLRFSDHRPVYATFSCSISVVDENSRDKLAVELRNKAKNALASGESSDVLDSGTEDADEDDFVDISSLNTGDHGLPPPSSASRKWWLDNSMSVRSVATIPSDSFELALDRPINPFSLSGQVNKPKQPDQEPEWVKVDANAVPPPPPPRRSGASRLSGRAAAYVGRIMEEADIDQKKVESVPKLEHQRQLPSESEYRMMKAKQASSPRPPPPPKAKSLLPSKNEASQTGEAPPPAVIRKVLPPPPPSRGTSTIDTPPVSPSAERKVGPPPKPKKPSTLVASPMAESPKSKSATNLMDDKDEGMDGLRDWEILKPVYT